MTEKKTASTIPPVTQLGPVTEAEQPLLIESDTSLAPYQKPL